MINFISSWAEQIVLAVIIATIIELILPKNKNRKYIQMVIGVYVLFNIISPIIKNKEAISVENYDIGQYQTNSTYEIDQSSMDARIEKIYLEELQNNITSEFENAGFTVEKCIVDAELDTNKKNAGIHLITIKIKDHVDAGEINKKVEELAKEYEISKDKIKIIIK